MELNVVHKDSCVLANTLGSIDESAEELFRIHLHPLFCEPGARVVLDLSQSKFINSLGLGQLVMLAAHANTAGGRVVLAAPTSFVSVVLARSKLDQFLETTETVPEAIEKLR